MRFMLVCLDSPNQVALGNADMQNIVAALNAAHEAADGEPTEFDRLRSRLEATFSGDVR